MLPDSETFEGFYDGLREIDLQLAKLKSAEVTRTELITALGTKSKQWLGYSQSLRQCDACSPSALDTLDGAMQDILRSTAVRTRASTYRKKLSKIIGPFIDQVIVPIIQFEGSPTQIAARQLSESFSAKITTGEAAYIDEAVRCAAQRCFRAAIIMLWAAGISRLHRAVEKAGFDAFNKAAAATTVKKGNPFNRVQKGVAISSLPELQLTRDFDILVIGMELWKYDLQVYEELNRLLGIRNSAAHPGMLQPGALDVQQFAIKVNAHVFGTVPS